MEEAKQQLQQQCDHEREYLMDCSKKELVDKLFQLRDELEDQEERVLLEYREPPPPQHTSPPPVQQKPQARSDGSRYQAASATRLFSPYQPVVEDEEGTKKYS